MGTLRAVFEGRDVVLAAGVVQGKAGYISWLRELGAARIVVIASMGTGPVPEADELVLLDVASTDPVDEFRQWERIAADPPPEVVDVLARHPDALLMFNGFESMTSFAGRPAFGARPASWTALEDKTTIDALWDELGIVRPWSRVVPAGEASGEGVWSGDASRGFNGGGQFVHWVRSPDDEVKALEHLRPRCDRVRIAEFVEGIPCSIHGFVTSRSIAVLRPVEMIVLRAERAPYFRYAGCATTWDPPDVDREAMRAIARRVGAALRERVGYRGFFTIDGVMSADGWLPTELNTRIGGGLSQLRRGASDRMIQLVHLATIAGAIEPDADEMEASLLPLVDANRTSFAHMMVPREEHVTGEESFERDGITVVLGPSSAGALVQIRADDVPAIGESFAPYAARAIGWADERWSLGIGPLSSATDVRRGALLQE